MANKSNKKKNTAKASGKGANQQKSAVDQARRYAAQNAGKKDKKKDGITSREYWKGVKLEMSKVIWPTRKELGVYTGVVIVTCAAFALAFWGIDSGILAALKAVLGVTLG